MNIADMAVTGIILLIVVLSLKSIIKQHKKGGCSGQCGSCGHSCRH